MISKIYESNQILFGIGKRKGKTREEISLMVEQKKDKPNKTKLLRSKNVFKNK
jgi:hypothetical protein